MLVGNQNGTRTWEQGFTYDHYGNRTGHEKFIGATQLTQTNLTHPAIDENTNRFQSGQGYAFDKNGNLITDPTDSGRSFVFNADNKQMEVRDQYNNLIGEYFYDGEGKRIKKHTYEGGVLDEITIFVYSGGKLIAEYSTAPPPQDPTTKWTVTDQLGSPRILVNSLGEVVSRRDFMPFGEEIFPDGAHRTTNLKYNFGDNVRQKFTGYQKDEETQLDFAEARMYQNLHGRFTAVDPLLASGKSANPQTFNRYVYVANNPLMYTDPSGLQMAETIEEDDGPPIVVCCSVAYILERVTSIISFGGQTSRVFDSVPAYQMSADPESFEYNRRKQGNVVLRGVSPGNPSDGYYPYFTPEEAKKLEDAINTVDQTGLFNLMNTSYKHSTGQAGNLELGGSALMFGSNFIPGGKAGGKLAKEGAERTGIRLATFLGKEGENAVGITGPKRMIESLTGTAARRFPDQLTTTSLIEVKNVRHLDFTNQIKDFHLFSQQKGLTFTIFTRENTTFSGPLQNMFDTGQIRREIIPFFRRSQ